MEDYNSLVATLNERISEVNERVKVVNKYLAHAYMLQSKSNKQIKACKKELEQLQVHRKNIVHEIARLKNESSKET